MRAAISRSAARFAKASALFISICASPHIRAACTSPLPPPNHPALSIFSEDYFRAVSLWAELPSNERELLARVSILQRNTKLADKKLNFQSLPPPGLAPVPSARAGARLQAEAANGLDKLLTAARAADHGGIRTYFLNVGDTYRSFEEQKTNWNVNLKRYFSEQKTKLEAFKTADRRYSDDAVCAMRNYAAVRYAFPGFSNHQNGLAVDLHAKEDSAPRLVASTSKALIGDTGLTNIQLWCQSWTFRWLAENASTFGFVQAPIDEPWHWEYRPEMATDPVRASYTAPSCKV